MAHAAGAALCLALLTPVAFGGPNIDTLHSDIPFARFDVDPGAVTKLTITSRTGGGARGQCVVRARRERDGSVSLDLRTEGARVGFGSEFERRTELGGAEYPLREGLMIRSDRAATYVDGHLRIRDRDPSGQFLRVYDVTIDRWLNHATAASIADYDGSTESDDHRTFLLTCEPSVG